MPSRSKILEVVSLQLPANPRYQENLDLLFEYLEEHQEQDIVVAPEVCLTGYDYAHLTTAVQFSANAIKKLKKVVDTQIVVLSIIAKDGDDFVNQAVVIHKHKVVYRQEKVKLFKMGDEDIYLKAGKKKRIKPFEIEGVKYAILICFELRFKELWRQIEGADVVIVPARWGKARKRQLEILSEALAVMNQCYVVLSNASDEDMASSSAIISPFGEVVRDDRQKAIRGTIDFREIKKMRRYIPMLRGSLN